MNKKIKQIEFKKDLKSIDSYFFNPAVEITSDEIKRVLPSEFDEAYIDYERESELLSHEEIKSLL